MKAFLIFVPQVAASVEHASVVVEEFGKFPNWDLELLPGATPVTLPLFQKWFPFQDQAISRINGFRTSVYSTYETKLSCFYNHVRVWTRCVELGEPVAFIEHDAVPVRDWDHLSFREVLILNAESSLRQSTLAKNLRKQGYTDPLQVGCHPWTVPVWNRHVDGDPTIMMPGTAAYAITPATAARFLQRVQTMGWEQSDHFINASHATIEYCVPEYFDLRLENLRLSHGLNTQQ